MMYVNLKTDYNPIEKSWVNMKRFLRNNLRDFFMGDFVVYGRTSSFHGKTGIYKKRPTSSIVDLP